MFRRFAGLAALAALGSHPALATAQTEVQLKGGVTFANLSTDGVLPQGVRLSERTGFAGGLGINFRFAKILGLGFEGLYVQDGARQTSGTGTIDLKLGMISVPALFRLTIPTPILRPYGFAGPQFNYELSCSASVAGACGTDRKKTSWAAVAGVGAVIGGGSGLVVEARYVYGLSELSTEALGNARSRTLLLLAGFQF